MEEEIIIIESEEEQEIITIEEDIEYIEPTTQEKTVIPTEEQQIVVPDDGVFALSKVNVEPIPSEYIKPSGTLDINANGEYDVTDYAKANVKVGEVEKGLVINGIDEDGFVTNAEIIGMTEIPEYYFYNILHKNNCLGKKLVNFSLPNNLTKINAYGFYDCNGIKKLVLPNTLTYLGERAFYNCENLILTELPDTITEIGTYAFYNCYNILISKLPSDLTQIKSDAFYGCSNITISSIPNKVTSIAQNAFRSSTGIETLDVLSEMLTTIGNYAFYGCSKLKQVIFRKTTPPTLNTGVFTGTPIASGTGYIYVPDESISLYQNATNWSKYASAIKGLSELEG